MATEKLFEAALGIGTLWFIAGTKFEPQQRTLRIRVDFKIGSRFAVRGTPGSIRCTTRSPKPIGT